MSTLRVTMENGEVWDIPLRVIAMNRDAYYEAMGEVEDSEALFADDPYEATDWAANNMNWEDVCADAVRAPDAEESLAHSEMWINADMEVIES